MDVVSRSWWFLDAQQEMGAPTRLAADYRADVVVVGGGLTGLWSALALSERDPHLEIAVIESDRCGGQASGKNGGIVHGYWNGCARIVEAVGLAQARTIVQLGSLAQEKIREFCEPRADQVWWCDRGLMRVATTAHQEQALGRTVAAAQALAGDAPVIPLSREDAQARVNSARFRAGVFVREAATLHPIRLVLALRAQLEAQGVAIYERTPVRQISSAGDAYRLQTPSGAVEAATVILATNTGLLSLSAVARHVANFSSYAVMTAPVPELLSELGWRGGEAVADSRMFLHYSRTTPDGRILMGTGSGPIGFAGRYSPSLTRDRAAIGRAIKGLRHLYPQAKDVVVEHSWGGPIDVSSDHLPFFGCADGRGIFFAAGYSGHGVNASWIAGQVLASLALRADDRWTSSPFVSRRIPSFPPEPFRYVGGRLIQKAILACEEAEETGHTGPLVARLIAALPGKLGLRIGTR